MKLHAVVFFIAAILLAGCKPHTKSELIAALHQYDRLIQKMDADSIAQLYTIDGELGTSAKGRNSIRKFLSSFNNVKVLFVASQSDSITVTGDRATQTGTYKQEVLVSGKDTLHLKGRFQAAWQWVPRDGWHIRRMSTIPDK